jgi:protein ImuB
VTEPWPGAIPDPPPAAIHPDPLPAEVVDHQGQPVRVSGRGEPTAVPAGLAVEGGGRRAVAAWAGPWPVDERWWDPAGHRRRARYQVRTDDGVARLVTLEGGRWWVEATYD